MKLEKIHAAQAKHPSHQLFIAVVHCVHGLEPLSQATTALEQGADGVIFISHNQGYSDADLLSFATNTDLTSIIGLNPLSSLGHEVKLLNSNPRLAIDFLWTDEQPTLSNSWFEELREGLAGLVYPAALAAGCAFKGMPSIADENLLEFSRQCQTVMDILVTSGPGTGIPALPRRVALIEKGSRLLALASGVNAENAKDYPNVDLFFVSSSIEIQHGKFDPKKISDLAQIIHSN